MTAETIHDTPEAAPAAGDAEVFTKAEIAQFEEDDAAAGRALGKMLATFFVYTIIAMSIAAWWTYTSVVQ